MATEKVPLNLFKRITTSLIPQGSAVYTVPIDRAGILINTYTTNSTNISETVSINISSVEQGPITLVNEFNLQPKDTINLTPFKVILNEGDVLSLSGVSGVNVTLSILEAVNTQ